VKVYDGPEYLNSAQARRLEAILLHLASRCGHWPDERPRVRTQRMIFAGYKDVTVTLELVPPSRVKVIQPTAGAKK
jgi:hypothetical protein